MKILLGGIPLGCDNIGDEAIVACVVRMLKSSIPGVSLTVATADASTAERLGVATVPPYGFCEFHRRCDFAAFASVARAHDAYVWCGATGLSDYPGAALSLLEAALGAGTPSFVWGVGMDDTLNPVYFRAAGLRLAFMRPLRLVGAYERMLRRRLSHRLASVLSRCGGVWLRDPQSADALARMGFAGAKVAADTAILMPEPPEPAARPGEPPALGLCISEQRRVADMAGVVSLVQTVRAAGFRVVGIPMNVGKDRALMESIGVECSAASTPEEVCAVAAGCGAVLSSRLHLLILAADAGTPGIGVARGSKIANWLDNFGERPAGDVEDCDWPAAAQKAVSLLRSGRSPWDAVRGAAYSRLHARLDAARAELVAKLSSLP